MTAGPAGCAAILSMCPFLRLRVLGPFRLVGRQVGEINLVVLIEAWPRFFCNW